MDTRYQRFVTLSYIIGAVLLAYVTFTLATVFSGTFDLETRVRNIEMIIRIGSVFIGFVAFFILMRHKVVNQYMNEVMIELSRVAWPTQKETTSATIIVIIMVLISGTILGVLDYIWTVLLKMVV